jgi:hypothetical protein
MTKLLEKEATFEWSPQCEDTFLTLKKLLTTAPVLAQPNIEKPFDVYCDAFVTGIGGVLMPPSVSPTSALAARCPAGGPHKLAGNTMPLASHHRAVGKRATTWAARVTAWARGLLRGWTGPPGRGLVAFRLAAHGRPPRQWTVAPGRIRPGTVRLFSIVFQLF